MNNFKNLTHEDETKSTDFQKPAQNLHIMSQICLSDKDIDHVLAEYSDAIKNLNKSESKDLMSTIFDSLDQEEDVVTPEEVNKTHHDPDNIFPNETTFNQFIDDEKITLNTKQNSNLMKDIRNKVTPTFEMDQDEKVLTSVENNKEISEFIEISVPAYGTVSNDEILKEENPFKEFDLEIDESIYAFGLGIAQFEKYNENDDIKDYDRIQNATDDIGNDADIMHIDFEEYIPVYANLHTAQTVNQVVDASINLSSDTITHDDLRSFRKETNTQAINVADNGHVGIQHHCGDNNCLNKNPMNQIAQSLNQVNAIILSNSSDLPIYNSDDDIPVSRLRNCTKNEKSLCGIKNKIETIISIDSEESDKDDDPCNGYHSSDFEFISETEAEMNGIISSMKDTKINKKHPKKAQTTKLAMLPGKYCGIKNKIETIISIDSEESDKDDDPCNGYHSSDFEFISETEAEMNGIISSMKDTKINKKHPKKAQTTKLEMLPGKYCGIQNKIETIISIDSEESDKHDDPCNGYHSSDFEFISENEAEMDGIISSMTDTKINKKHPKKAQTTKLEMLPGTSTETAKIQNKQVFLEDRNEKFRDKDNHRVPEGDNFLALFQGIYNPIFTSAMENKSIYCSAKATMLIEFEGVGFDMQVMNGRNRELDIDEEYKDEANETARRIMQMYPDANKKNRRPRF